MGIVSYYKRWLQLKCILSSLCRRFQALNKDYIPMKSSVSMRNHRYSWYLWHLTSAFASSMCSMVNWMRLQDICQLRPARSRFQHTWHYMCNFSSSWRSHDDSRENVWVNIAIWLEVRMNYGLVCGPGVQMNDILHHIGQCAAGILFLSPLMAQVNGNVHSQNSQKTKRQLERCKRCLPINR